MNAIASAEQLRVSPTLPGAGRRFPASPGVTLLFALLIAAGTACGGDPPRPGPATATATATPAPAATAATAAIPTGALLYRTAGNGTFGLFKVDVDGTHLAELPGNYRYGDVLSPGGTQVGSTRGGHVWLTDADGSHARDLTPDVAGAAFVSWSPDSSRLMFGFFGETFSEYWVMHRDGTGRVMVVPRCTYPRTCYEPQWSPDSSQLLAEVPSGAAGSGETALVVVAADGATLRSLPRSPDGWDEFAWSPDGKTIAYTSGTHAGRGVLSVMAPDGSNVRASAHGDQLHSLAWSPDSARIAFAVDVQARYKDQVSPPPAHWELAVSELASDATRVLATSGLIARVAWSPDGVHLSYTGSDGDSAVGGSQAFVIKASGGTPVNVSRGPWNDVSEGWSPDGRSLIVGSDRNSRDGVYALDPSTGASSLVTLLPPDATRAELAAPPHTTGGCIPADRRPTSRPLYACKSADRSSEASIEGGRLVVRDLATSTVRAMSAAGLAADPSPPAWSPDGTRVAFHARDGDAVSLYVLDVRSGDNVRVTSADATSNVTLSAIWAPDGGSIYFTDGAVCTGGCTLGFLYRINPDGSKREQLTTRRVLTLYGFAP